MVALSEPFSPEDPCDVCGAGMSHRPDGHAVWCRRQARVNEISSLLPALHGAGGRPDGEGTGHMTPGPLAAT